MVSYSGRGIKTKGTGGRGTGSIAIKSRPRAYLNLTQHEVQTSSDLLCICSSSSILDQSASGAAALTNLVPSHTVKSTSAGKCHPHQDRVKSNQQTISKQPVHLNSSLFEDVFASPSHIAFAFFRQGEIRHSKMTVPTSETPHNPLPAQHRHESTFESTPALDRQSQCPLTVSAMVSVWLSNFTYASYGSINNPNWSYVFVSN